MARLDLSVLSDIGLQLAAWEEQYVSLAGFSRYQRACAFVVDETAKDMKTRMTEALPAAVDRPTPWMLRAFQYTRGLKRGQRATDSVSADVYVLDDQSIVLKYLMGDGPNTRMPGDVGLARQRILVPNWQNLQDTQGIKPNRYGNLPGGVAARFKREAAGTLAKRRVRGRWGVYEGELAAGGSRIMGYIARPPREKKPVGKNGRMIWQNVGRPRLLLAAIPKATYTPILQREWETAQRDALNAIPERMAAELAENLRHMAERGRLQQARELNQALAAIQRAGVAGREGETRALLARARNLLSASGR